jgi:parallel beta-helix repeat protein
MGGSSQNVFKSNLVVSNLKGFKINNVQQTKIENNIFASNLIHVLFINCHSQWSGNYWGRPRILPKPIPGKIGILPAVQFDMHPAFIPPINRLSMDKSLRVPSVYKIQETCVPSMLIAQERMKQFPPSVPELIPYQYDLTDATSFP